MRRGGLLLAVEERAEEEDMPQVPQMPSNTGWRGRYAKRTIGSTATYPRWAGNNRAWNKSVRETNVCNDYRCNIKRLISFTSLDYKHQFMRSLYTVNNGS